MDLYGASSLPAKWKVQTYYLLGRRPPKDKTKDLIIVKKCGFFQEKVTFESEET